MQPASIAPAAPQASARTQDLALVAIFGYMRSGRRARTRDVVWREWRRFLFCCFALGEPVKQVKEQRHVEHGERRLAEHPADDPSANRMPGIRAGADRDGERKAADRERERGHDD